MESHRTPDTTTRPAAGPPKKDMDARTTTSTAKNPVVTVTSPVRASIARSLRSTSQTCPHQDGARGTGTSTSASLGPCDTVAASERRESCTMKLGPYLPQPPTRTSPPTPLRLDLRLGTPAKLDRMRPWPR